MIRSSGFLALICRLAIPFGCLNKIFCRPAIGELQTHAELHVGIFVVSVDSRGFWNGFLRIREEFAIPRFIHVFDHRLAGAEYKQRFLASAKKAWVREPGCARLLFPFPHEPAQRFGTDKDEGKAEKTSLSVPIFGASGKSLPEGEGEG